MKRKYLQAAAAALAALSLLTACGGDEPSETEENTSGTEAAEQSENTQEEQSKSESAGTFAKSGSSMTMENGELSVSRRSRTETSPMGEDNWTLLVYMCGSDLESESYAATSDMIEAISGECSENVTMIFETGGANAWYDDIISSDSIQRHVVIDGDISTVDELPNANMGSSDTLADFLEWGVENYPAEHMGVIFWNHGGGSISGVCFDELNDYDSLSLKEIDEAMNSVYDKMTDKFEFIGFDACLMGTLETANMLVPYARYMCGSQEFEPGSGWDYTAVMNFLAENNDADGAELGRAAADSFYAQCDESDCSESATLSVIDLEAIDELVISFDKTAKELYEGNNFTSSVRAITEADNFGGNTRSEGYSNMVDMEGMLRNISEYASNAADTLEKLDKAVVYTKNGSDHSEAGGLSLYFPLSVQGSTELSDFSQICTGSYYLAYVDAVAYGSTGKDVSDYDNSSIINSSGDIWDTDYEAEEDYTSNSGEFADADSDSTVPVSAVYFDDDGYYTVDIDDWSNYSYAECSLFMTADDGSYIYIGSLNDVDADMSAGTIKDNFDGTWMVLDDGTILPIELIDVNDEYSLFTCTIYLNDELTNLRIKYDFASESWEMIGCWAGISNETGMAAKDIVKLKEGDIICPVYYYIDSDSGSDYFLGDEYTVTSSTSVYFEYLPAADYSYSISIYDIYGNCYYTPDVTFSVDEEGGITFYPEDLGQNTSDFGASDSSYDAGDEDIDLEYDEDSGLYYIYDDETDTYYFYDEDREAFFYYDEETDDIYYLE